MFFDIVERLFGGDKNVHVYASGANPPSDETAKRNANQVLGWISSLKNKGWEADVSFEKGDPSKPENNLDCYGLHCDENGNIVVNNNRICLTIDQRDPTGGLQTLFCIFGNPDVIRYQPYEFLESNIEDWVKKGKEKGFDKAVDMTDAEILQNFSSTPEYEVPWFCDTIRQAGQYVKDHINEGRTLECVQ